jgi:hypothetical protein
MTVAAMAEPWNGNDMNTYADDLSELGRIAYKTVH